MAFSTLLIANRGEIACRIARSARTLGYRTVAVYSEADRGALHVESADVAVCIGAAAPSASYLNIPALIEAARRTGADAIHPGYGFLAENADFARACAAAGIRFVGPSPEAIDAMGNKRAARRRMAAVGVPCVPGYDEGSQDEAVLIAAAGRIGYPLMVKAAAGGGGRGLRRVLEAAALPAALAAARAEAQSAFGSGELILERAVVDARHVEVQVFGDAHGNIIHLGERDCSAQRRNQKVLEESPSPAVDAALRARMGETAVTAARAIGYVGAGTVEMLLAADGSYYFLEMNTRLQVEHPVTEFVTGLDLVDWQLRVAAGEPLPLEQDQVQMRGHAIEARLYAEDPDANYAPQTGPILCWRAPAADLARTDTGIGEGRRVGADYDPMLAKIIAHGANRDEARRKLVRALEETVLLGLRSNRGQLIELLQDEVFRSGGVTTRWLDTRTVLPRDDAATARQAAALAAVLSSRVAAASGWRAIHAVRDADGAWHVQDGARLWVFELPAASSASAAAHATGPVAPMSGRVAEIFVAAGEAVEKGGLLMTLEAMKMYHEIRAGRAGRVAELLVAVGQQVDPRQALLKLEDAA